MRIHRLRSGLVGGGYLLSVNGLVAAGLGFAFWLLAAREFSPSEVGFSAAVMGAVMVLSGIGTLGLQGAFLRYIPISGNAWGSLVARGYLVAAAASITLAGGFALVVGQTHIDLTQLASGRWIPVFLLSAGVWAIFVLQDFVLITHRRADIVLLENTLVAVARLAILIALSGGDARSIIIAWVAPSLLATLVVNLFIARLAVAASGWRVTLRRPMQAGVVRYCATTSLATIATVVSFSLLPVLVTAIADSTTNARFFLPWSIATSLQVIAASMSSPLQAEISRGLDRERAAVQRVIRHVVGTLLIVGLPLVLVAPAVLAHLGRSYQVSRALLVLLLAATIINGIATVFQARARAHGNVHGYALAQWTVAAVLIVGSAVMLPRVGLIGIGWSALTAQFLGAVIAVVADADGAPSTSRVDQASR